MDLKTLLIEKIPSNIQFKFNEFKNIKKGVIVIYPIWSIDQKYFDLLISALNEQKYSSIILCVIDIDSNICRKFEEYYNVLNHGKCEMYAINSSNIISSIKEHHRDNSLSQIKELLHEIIR